MELGDWLRRACAMAAMGLVLASLGEPAAGGAGCPTNVIGIDTTKATSHDDLRFGEAAGQVILARDTLISSVTVWRFSWGDTNSGGLRLLIALADSTGRPLPNSVIFEGPTVRNPYPDGKRYVPYRFDLDPPFALPGPGRYEIAIQVDPCGGLMEFADTGNDAYPEGNLWWHHRTAFGGCHLRNYPTDLSPADLIFEVEFCQSTTPVEAQTWGRLKSFYR